MQYIVLDVETTGLSSNDEVIQMSAMFLNKTFDTCSEVINFYCMPTAPISHGAAAVHHLTLSKLKELSNLRFFESYFYPLSKKFSEDCTFIAYSDSGFDFRLINQTLARAGLPAYDFGEKIKKLDDGLHGHHTFDLMSAMARYGGLRWNKIKLENALKLLPNYNKEDLEIKYMNFSRIIDKQDTAEGQVDLFHNARFDTFSLWYILNNVGNKFKVK